MAQIEQVYYGEIEAMIAEVGAFDPRIIDVSAKECRFLVLPMGPAGTFDTEWFSSRKAAREHAEYIAKEHDGCKICAVY